MTHPHQLHATAALASLRAALDALAHGTVAERYGWTQPSDSVRSWSPSNGRAAGSHSDPVATAVTDTVRTKCARRAQWTFETLRWLEHRLGLRPSDAPLQSLELEIPLMRPSTARQLTLWARDLNNRVRDDVGLDDGLIPAGIVSGHSPTCSACSVRLVYRTPAGYLICRNQECVCAGDVCPCTMPIKAAGVEHIWAPA